MILAYALSTLSTRDLLMLLMLLILPISLFYAYILIIIKSYYETTLILINLAYTLTTYATYTADITIICDHINDNFSQD